MSYKASRFKDKYIRSNNNLRFNKMTVVTGVFLSKDEDDRTILRNRHGQHVEMFCEEEFTHPDFGRITYNTVIPSWVCDCLDYEVVNLTTNSGKHAMTVVVQLHEDGQITSEVYDQDYYPAKGVAVFQAALKLVERNLNVVNMNYRFKKDSIYLYQSRSGLSATLWTASGSIDPYYEKINGWAGDILLLDYLLRKGWIGKLATKNKTLREILSSEPEKALTKAEKIAAYNARVWHSKYPEIIREFRVISKACQQGTDDFLGEYNPSNTSISELLRAVPDDFYEDALIVIKKHNLI